MPLTNITIDISNTGTRNEVRTKVLEVFLEEEAGQGSGENASKYDYFVKSLQNGGNVVLRRPANLKNGFDFLIKVDNIDFSNGNGRRRDYPKHDEIIDDLILKQQSNQELYTQLYNLIERTYNCEEVTDDEIALVNFQIGFDTDMLIHVIKWFFIEQDIRYWNYSGRNMLFSGIPTP